MRMMRTCRTGDAYPDHSSSRTTYPSSYCSNAVLTLAARHHWRAMPADSNTSPAPLSKEARKSCHSARDAFYACVREQGVEFAPGTKPPARCTRLRQQFEGACPASWVKHFDELQEANIRRAKYLAATIGRAATNAAGSLEGKAQQ